jgi:hypothetical protein
MSFAASRASTASTAPRNSWSQDEEAGPTTTQPKWQSAHADADHRRSSLQRGAAVASDVGARLLPGEPLRPDALEPELRCGDEESGAYAAVDEEDAQCAASSVRTEAA